jgi:hypothetical protein
VKKHKHQWKLDDSGAKYCVICDINYHEIFNDLLQTIHDTIEAQDCDGSCTTYEIEYCPLMPIGRAYAGVGKNDG